MNQHNLISIVPTISEMGLDKDKKCREVNAKIHKLIGKLEEMFDKSNLDKQKRNKEYRGYLQRLQDSVKPTREISFESIRKVELHLTELEKKIKNTEEKEVKLCGTQRFLSPDSTVIQEIDLTHDDGDSDRTQEGSSSPSVLQPDSTVCENEQRMNKRVQSGNSPLLNGENIVSSSGSHHTGRFMTQKKTSGPIIDIEDLCKNLPQTNTYMTNLSHRTSSTTDFSNIDDSSMDDSPKRLKDNPVLRIFELAKQNTSGSTGTDYSLSDMDVESPSSVSATPVEDVAEKVTRLIKKLPDEDREVLLKKGVNNIHELVEKKSKFSLPLLNYDSDSMSDSSKCPQTAVNNSPRLSELLLEQMESPSITTQSTTEPKTSISSQSVVPDESSKPSSVLPKQSFLSKNISGADRTTNTETVLTDQTAEIPQPVPRPNIFNKSDSREPSPKGSQISQPRTPQPVPRPVISNTSTPNSQRTRTTLLSHPIPQTALQHRFPIRPQPPALPALIPSFLNQPPRNCSNEQLIKKVTMPECSSDSWKKTVPCRSAPLPVPNISSDPRKNNLRSKFSQEIGVVHKVGDSQKICPSLKQLKNDKRPCENPSTLIDHNISSPVNTSKATVPGKDALPKPSQCHAPSDPRLLSKHVNPNQIQKKFPDRKPPLPSPSSKKSSVHSNPLSRRRSSEGSSRSNTSSPEGNISQNSKQSTKFQSPLADIYSAHLPTARTGLGYGVQKFKPYKIPKIHSSEFEKKKEFSGTMKSKDRSSSAPGVKPEEDESASIQKVSKHVGDQVEIAEEQLEKNEKSFENDMKACDALPQRTRPLKPSIRKTPASILKKSFLEGSISTNDLEENRDKCSKNSPENKLQETDSVEKNVKITELDLQNKSEKNLTFNEDGESNLIEVVKEKNETSKIKSTAKSNISLPQPKPFRIILNDVETRRFEKKSTEPERSSISQESSIRRGSRKELSSTTEDEDEEEEKIKKSTFRSKSMNKKKPSKLKSSSSEETDGELSSLKPVAKLEKTRILSSSDESSAEVENKPTTNTEVDIASTRPLKEFHKTSFSNFSSSANQSSTTLLQTTTITKSPCFDDCLCASEIVRAISPERNSESKSTDVEDSIDSRPQNPESKSTDVEDSIDSRPRNPESKSTDVEDPIDSRPMPKLPDSSHKLTLDKDTMYCPPEKLENKNIKSKIPSRGASSKTSGTSSTAKKKIDTRKMVKNLRACPELAEVRDLLEDIDENDNQNQWLFDLLKQIDKELIVHVQRIISQVENENSEDELDEPTASGYSNSIDQSRNADDENSASEMQDAVADESITPVTKAPSKAKFGGRKKRVKSTSKRKSKVNDVDKSVTKKRIRGNRELNQLHADIRKMKRTKKNNIFDAVGERKCRKRPISYQERSTRYCESSIPRTITPSSEDFEFPSDTDSTLSEKKSQGRRSTSTDIVSDDSMYSNQILQSGRSQTANRRRRGRPAKETIRSQWIIASDIDNKVSEENEEPECTPDPIANKAPEYRPGPRSMKIRMYGEEAVQEYNLKELCVTLTKIPVTDVDEKIDENAFIDDKKIENISLEMKIRENVDSVTEQLSLESRKNSNEVDIIMKKRRKKKKKKQKKISREHLEKIMEECANTLNSLHSSDLRKSSSNSNPPLENKENSPPCTETETDKDLDEHTDRRIADLPECNAFKEDRILAGILSIAIKMHESKLLYMCSGPECSHSTYNSTNFANHLSLIHKNVLWKGDCSLCGDAVHMDGQADLIDALSHLMNKHLKMVATEVINIDLTEEENHASQINLEPNPINQSVKPANNEPHEKGSSHLAQVPKDIHEDYVINLDDDEIDTAERVSIVGNSNSDSSLEESSITELQTPRLRVRRLSGDLLSGATSSSDTAVESASTPINDSASFSIVIKEVKSKQGEKQGEESSVDKPCENTISTSKTDNSYFEEQQRYDDNIPPKILYNNSAHAEMSIIKLYKCGGTTWNNPETCKFSSDVSQDFFQHLKRCHLTNKKTKTVAKKFLKCVYCGEQNSDAEKMVLHIENVHRICRFQCPYCEYRASRPIYLKWHRDSEHQFHEERILVPELKDNVSEVQERSRSTLWSKPYAEIILPFSCTHSCEYSTYSEPEFIQHSKTNHNEVASWKCSQCNHICLDLPKLMAHYRSFHGMAMYQCRYCKHGAPTKQLMTSHLAKSHPHLYPSVLTRKPSSSGNDNSWDSRVVDFDLDEPFSKFKSSLRLVKIIPHNLGADTSPKHQFKPAVAPMSIAEETEAAVSAITLGNDTPAVPSNQNNSRRHSAISLYSSDDDISDRLVINEDDCEDFNPTIAERLRPVRRSSVESQPISRSRPNKELTTGLDGSALYKCGMAGCSIAVDDFKSYEEHLKVCDNARNSTSFECPHCDYKVQSVPKFLSHLLMHGPSRYHCSLCEFKHQDSRKVIEHMRSVMHRVQGEPEIVPIIPLKKDKYKDLFVIKFDPVKIVRSKGSRVSTEGLKYPRSFQPPPKPLLTISSEQTKQITTVNSWEDVEKFLPMQTFRDFVVCGICPYKNKVRSNLLNHMKLHATGGLTTSENIVNPVPQKDKVDYEFNKMANHAGYAKNENRDFVKLKEEVSDNSEVPGKKIPIPDYVPKSRRFTCNAPGCSYLSPDVCGLKNHYITLHRDLTQFKCPHCKTIVTISKINTHLRYHGDKLYKCGCCDYVHFQRKLIEKHQQEQHNNHTHNIVVVREISLMESEQLDRDSQTGYEGMSPSGECATSKMSKCSWKCNLCGDLMNNEVLMRTHCQTKHSISYQYKCCLCDFGTFRKGEIDEHIKMDHDGSSQIFLSIYKEMNDFSGSPGSTTDQSKPSSSKCDVAKDNQAPSSATEKVMRLDNTPTASCTSSDSESSRCVPVFPNVDDSNEMMVEPYADGTFRCPSCTTFRTSSLQEMRYHIFKEKNYERYVCTACAAIGVSRAELEPHIILDRKNHPPKKEKYILKLTADTALELKVKQALAYQVKKLNLNSSIGSAPFFDSDDDNVSLVESENPLTDSDFQDTKVHEGAKITSPSKRCKKQKTRIIPSSAFVCSMCPKYFSSLVGLKLHQKVHKKKESESPPPDKRTNGEVFVKDNLLASKSSKPVEVPILPTSSKETDDLPTTKRARLSPSKEETRTNNRNPVFPCELCSGDSRFVGIHDLQEHEKQIHRWYPCLFCDKILVGERKLSEHLRASLKLLEDGQTDDECKRSDNRIVKMMCSFCTTYSLPGVTLNHYKLVTSHIKNSHPSQQTDGLTVQIGASSPRPLADVEIVYLKAIERLSVLSTRKTRAKRRNVAVKSTARPGANSTEPPFKFMFLDGSAVSTLPAQYDASSSIIKASDGSTAAIVVAPFLFSANENDPDLSASVRSKQLKNSEDSTSSPSIGEVIVLDDDSPPM